MRLLGLDVGGRRIGVAVSDPLGVIASPLTTIQRSGLPQDIDAVLVLARDNDAREIVVGLPISLSGRASAQTRCVQAFVEALARRSEVPVRTHDERYSTVEARRLLGEGGVQASRDRPRLDAASAAVILQAHLDSTRPGEARRDP